MPHVLSEDEDVNGILNQYCADALFRRYRGSPRPATTRVQPNALRAENVLVVLTASLVSQRW